MISQWFDLQNEERATFVEVMMGDYSHRFAVGEIGILLQNDFSEKYDAKVLLAPMYGPVTLYGHMLSQDPNSLSRVILEGERIYYFYACDLRYLRGPGYGEFKPGKKPRGRKPDRVLQQAIAHDAKAGV